MKSDVVILGGGPAGSVLAERLSRRGYHVVLVERQPFPRFAVGESLPPSVELLLKRTGILSAGATLDFPRTTGYFSAWGSRTLLFNPHDAGGRRQGFQVDRSRFDAILLDAARNAGAEVLEGWWPAEILHQDAGWEIRLRSARGETRLLEAKFLCDASGRSRLLARKLRLQVRIHGRLIALLGYWQRTQQPSETDGCNTLVEALPEGWFYTAQLTPGKRVAGFLTGRELLPVNLRPRASALYSHALKQSRHVQRRLTGATWNGEVKIFAANPTLVEQCCGADWLLAGDAASTLDPLCSQGVQKAITSALAAATVVHTMFVHPERSDCAQEFYREREYSGFCSHLDALRRYYQREQRWTNQPFWKTRAMAATTDPSLSSQSVTAPRVALRPSDRLRPSKDARIVARPVVEGEFVEIRPVVLSPQVRRGLRYFGALCVPDLLQRLKSKPTVTELVASYPTSAAGQRTNSLPYALSRLLHLGIVQCCR